LLLFYFFFYFILFFFVLFENSAHSTEVNQARLRLLKAREEAIQKVLEEAHKNLGKIAKSPQYKPLLKNLIVQVRQRKIKKINN